LTSLPFREDDFVWCAFPEHENPAQPGPLHLGYTLAASSAVPPVSPMPSALITYTTSRPWPPDMPLPLGVQAFNREAATRYGQSRAFVMDLRRIAFVPTTPAWFPRIEQPGHGIQGHAPKAEQRRFRQLANELAIRHSELVERLGPLWPRGGA
jgi:hypothetical protein